MVYYIYMVRLGGAIMLENFQCPGIISFFLDISWVVALAVCVGWMDIFYYCNCYFSVLYFVLFCPIFLSLSHRCGRRHDMTTISLS